MSFTLAIVGRPNVGKSTLFNRLCRKKMAIVDDRPGVTRDFRDGKADLFGQEFRVIDTAGLEDRFDGSLEARMRTQTDQAIKAADVILFVVDGRDGLTPLDHHFAAHLRKTKKPLLLAVNKCDHDGVANTGVAEAYSLGLGDAIAMSSAHGHGLDDLYQALMPYFPEETPLVEETDQHVAEPVVKLPDNIDDLEGREDVDLIPATIDDDTKPIKVAIVGRPNVGKSTLMNALLGEERVMTGPEAGITRDAIAATWVWENRKFRLVDTAGLRRKARIIDPLEQQSADDSLRAIRLAHIVFLVIDATIGLEGQDLKIAQHIVDEGRVLILVANKWDVVTDRQTIRTEMGERLEKSLGQLPKVPMVTVSALNGNNLDLLMRLALEHYMGWTTRVSTAGLNRWLSGAVSHYPPPLVQGRPNTLKYITQINVKPPTFALWVTHPDGLPDSYRRYIMNAMRERFSIPSVPIRLLLRKSKNPFAG